MPNPYAAEFRADTVRVTRKRETRLTPDGQNVGVSEARMISGSARATAPRGLRALRAEHRQMARVEER
jgi:hypothetical protein